MSTLRFSIFAATVFIVAFGLVSAATEKPHYQRQSTPEAEARIEQMVADLSAYSDAWDKCTWRLGERSYYDATFFGGEDCKLSEAQFYQAQRKVSAFLLRHGVFADGFTAQEKSEIDEAYARYKSREKS